MSTKSPRHGMFHPSQPPSTTGGGGGALTPVPEEESSSPSTSRLLNNNHSTTTTTNTTIDPTTKTPLENEQHEQTIIDFQSYWDVVAPAPNTSVKGQFVKGVFKTMGKQRRISLEVHKIPIPKIPSGLDIESDSSDDDEEEEDLGGGFGGDYDGSFVEKAYVRLSKRKMIRQQQQKQQHVGKKSKNIHPNSSSGDGGSSSVAMGSVHSDDASSIFTSDDHKSIIEFPPEEADFDPLLESSPLSIVEEDGYSPIQDANSDADDNDDDDNTNIPPPKRAEFHFDSDTFRAKHNGGGTRRTHAFSSKKRTHQTEKWYTKYKFEVANIHIVKINNNAVTLHLLNPNITRQNSNHNNNNNSQSNHHHSHKVTYNEEREIMFNSSLEAKDFCDKLETLKQKDQECRSRNYVKAVKGLDIEEEDMDKNIDFLIEIVGAEKLVVSGA